MQISTVIIANCKLQKKRWCEERKECCKEKKIEQVKE